MGPTRVQWVVLRGGKSTADIRSHEYERNTPSVPKVRAYPLIGELESRVNLAQATATMTPD